MPVPRVLGVHPVHQAMLSERVQGGNWFSRITDPAEQEATAQDFMTKLAALHSLDAAKLDLPAFPAGCRVWPGPWWPSSTSGNSCWRRGAGHRTRLSPSRCGGCGSHIPDYDGPPVLVQGDTGPGNFMYAGGTVTAVVDWELAHLGDPMDDIAWLSLRATQEPLPDFPTRLREYEELSGNPIDEARVRYYRVMAETKLQVMSHRGPTSGDGRSRDAGGGGGNDVGNGFIYQVLHRRLWLEALASANGLELAPAETPQARDPRDIDWMYDAVLTQLRDVIVPRTTDPLAQARGKGVARIVKYLARVDTYGPYYEECELRDLATLLGRRPDSVLSGRVDAAAAVAAGAVSEQDYILTLWRRIARETELARPSMGVLADRHWPPLR